VRELSWWRWQIAWKLFARWWWCLLLFFRLQISSNLSLKRADDADTILVSKTSISRMLRGCARGYFIFLEGHRRLPKGEIFQGEIRCQRRGSIAIITIWNSFWCWLLSSSRRLEINLVSLLVCLKLTKSRYTLIGVITLTVRVASIKIPSWHCR